MNRLATAFVFVLPILLIRPALSVGPKDPLAALTSVCHPQAPRKFRTEGDWGYATEDEHNHLFRRYQSGTGQITVDPVRVGRVTAKELGVDYHNLSRDQIKGLEKEGLRSISALYYITSGAGLWTRGGRVPKALVPLNIAEILGSEFQEVKRLAYIRTGESSEQVLERAGITAAPDDDPVELKLTVMERTKSKLDQLLVKANRNPKALTPLDIKLANVALESLRAGRGIYIPFDVVTSEETHRPIVQYLDWFRTNYSQKVFHLDPEVNRKIHLALQNYFSESGKRGETHVFGFQRGFSGIDILTGQAVPGTGVIGTGAGTIKGDLDSSGRTGELARNKISILMFDNIEVVTNLPLTLGAHLQAGKPVSVILVPKKPIDKGGDPFLVDGQLKLIEASALPAGSPLLEGNVYFNSNTLVMPLEAVYPDVMGFEKKTENGHRIIRGKVNMGDVTLKYPTSGIGGRQGVEYQTLKSFEDYEENGAGPIAQSRHRWGEILGR